MRGAAVLIQCLACQTERESGGANKAKHDFFNTRFTRIFLRIMVGRKKICTQRKVR